MSKTTNWRHIFPSTPARATTQKTGRARAAPQATSSAIRRKMTGGRADGVSTLDNARMPSPKPLEGRTSSATVKAMPMLAVVRADV